MSVKIGHASISEKKTINGSKGDSTSKEVCIRTWYKKPWSYVLRPINPNIAEKSAQACEDGCTNNNIGYGQADRNSAHTCAKSVNYDLSKIVTKCNTDCSAFMTLCAISAGVNKLEYSGNAPTTSSMGNAFVNSGAYIKLTDSRYLNTDEYLKRGDILVKPRSHTVMVLSNGSKASTIITDEDSSSAIKDIIKDGQEHAIKFTKIQIKVDGVIGKETELMKSRVLQHAINLDYNDSLKLDGKFGTKSKTALGNHFVKKGEIQYMVTAAEILMMLNGIDPNGVEYPGHYGNGLTRVAKQFFGDDGLKITSSEFLRLI